MSVKFDEVTVNVQTCKKEGKKQRKHPTDNKIKKEGLILPNMVELWERKNLPGNFVTPLKHCT